MSLFINTNIVAMGARRALANTNHALSQSFEQLSSGLKINRASDDSAGLQISSRMTSQIKGLSQAVRNANDGISLIQTADGALSEVATNLQRVRQLSIQAQNGINTSSDIQALQKEADASLAEINRISNTTQFAGQDILRGDFSARFLVGSNAGQNITVRFNQLSGLGFDLAGLNIAGIDVVAGTTTFGAPVVSNSGEPNALTNSIFRTDGLNQGVYKFAISNDAGQSFFELDLNLTGNDAAGISIMDAANIAEGIDSVLGSDSLGAGQDPIGQTVGIFIRPGNTQLRIAENVNNPSSLSINSIIGTYSSSPSASGINRKSPTSAIDGALSRINTLRTELGALENRFKSTIRSLSNISENVSDARSRIMDTDFASTTSRLTQSQIVQQASISVLAQANQRPQLALSLLE